MPSEILPCRKCKTQCSSTQLKCPGCSIANPTANPTPKIYGSEPSPEPSAEITQDPPTITCEWAQNTTFSKAPRF
ncbi:uncharacterized protein L3040_002930 [Drepanopeziza brunnea f. sp. 'multigermtubi']|uniref:uncharacterized protein n=1 Tax=Drepanopeziza brunnea f. sp. 'multigermtubi' TaxID=698441 RepID=UPI002398BD7A|nr:hypothetical protein L3040_002930 [Drepanopeziza brunnea f. sp. 'multigermtubi']